MKKCLRGVSAKRLVDAASETANPFLSSGWWPVLDGVEFKQPLTSLWKEGKMNDVQLLLGTNSQESVLFVYPFYPAGMLGHQPYATFLTDVLTQKDQNFSKETLDQIYAAYPGNPGDNRPMASQLLTEYTFLCGTQWVADGAAAAGHPPYVYRFNYRPACMTPNDLTLPGVYHTIELPFVFQTPLASECIYLPVESELAAAVGTLWTTFAKTGRLDGWPTWDVVGRSQVVLGLPARSVEKGYKQHVCLQWNKWNGWNTT
jgi:carboxylesterase type B